MAPAREETRTTEAVVRATCSPMRTQEEGDLVEREPLIHMIVRLTVEFRVGVNQVIDRRPALRRVKNEIPPDRKLHPIRIQRAEEEIVLRRVLPRPRKYPNRTQPNPLIDRDHVGRHDDAHHAHGQLGGDARGA